MKNSITKHKLYRKLLKEFHPTKNGDLKLSDFSHGSGKKVWWKCNNGANDHEWQASMDVRVSKNANCPCCSRHKVVLSNCLSTTHPKISKQWHPTKNGNLTPLDVVHGTQKKVWWKCNLVSNHEWEATIGSRAYMGDSCPFCTGRKVDLFNCLYTLNEKISKQWHPTKNGNLTPFDVTCGSNKKVWWRCDKDEAHEWADSVNHRSNKLNNRNCPFCSGRRTSLSTCLATTHPELSKQWHPTKNRGLTPLDLTHGSSKKIWWKCDEKEYHEWKTCVNNRTSKNGTNCPYCNESKGENKVKFILTKLFINYDTQKRYDDCRYKQVLSFDIYLSDYNALIEYDGELHYRPFYFSGGEKELKVRQKRDRIKTKYAKYNNIPLLRIPYTQFNNIEKIIVKFIEKLRKSATIQARIPILQQ